jgi:hypothetical protein
MLSRLVVSTRLLAIIGRRRILGATLCGAAASIALLILTQLMGVPLLYLAISDVTCRREAHLYIDNP